MKNMNIGMKVKTVGIISFNNAEDLPVGLVGEVIDVWGDGRLTVKFDDIPVTVDDTPVTVMDFEVSAIN